MQACPHASETSAAGANFAKYCSYCMQTYFDCTNLRTSVKAPGPPFFSLTAEVSCLEKAQFLDVLAQQYDLV